MVVDTSALLAILLSEPEAEVFAHEISVADRRLIGAPTLVEATAVLLARKGKSGVIALDALLARLVTISARPTFGLRSETGALT